jgi:DNA-binding NarL/FixJ family response regulator
MLSDNSKENVEDIIHDVTQPSDDRLLLIIHLQRKREFLGLLADTLDAIRNEPESVVRETLAKLPKDIRNQVRTFDRLTEIERNVAMLSSEFADALRRVCPSLTPTELQVCTYLRAGLTARQTADVMFVSVRAIEKHRQSIRKRLNISTHIDLRHHLAHLTGI